MKNKPYKYQLDDIKHIQRLKGRALLASEMGTGKSLIALLWAERHLDRSAPVVIVCPKTVKFHWEREIKRFTRRRVEVLVGSRPPRGDLQPCRYRIINYDILHGWLKKLVKTAPQLLIVDEAHYCKEMRTRRYKSIRQLAWKLHDDGTIKAKRIPHVLCLSGTPLTNRPAELWTTLHLLCPKQFPNFFRFCWKYAKPQRKPWGWTYDGTQNIPALHRKLNELCMIRRRKADVLKELPAKVRSIVPLPISDPKEYREAVDDFANWLRKTVGEHRAIKALRAERLNKHGYFRRLVARLKLPAVMEWVEDWLKESEGKLILFGVHRNILHPLHDHFGKRSVLVDGGVTGEARQRAIDRFTHKPKCRLFIGNIRAAGTGWNGTAATDVAFCELSYTPGEHTQAEDRPHRIGQKGTVNVHYLLARGTVEEDLCKLIQRKQRTLDACLDGRPIKGSWNLMDQLEQLILQEKKR